jgi:hypothetical protein
MEDTVQLNLLPDDGRVGSEYGSPDTVADDNDGRRAEPLVYGR